MQTYGADPAMRPKGMSKREFASALGAGQFQNLLTSSYKAAQLDLQLKQKQLASTGSDVSLQLVPQTTTDLSGTHTTYSTYNPKTGVMTPVGQGASGVSTVGGATTGATDNTALVSIISQAKDQGQSWQQIADTIEKSQGSKIVTGSATDLALHQVFEPQSTQLAPDQTTKIRQELQPYISTSSTGKEYVDMSNVSDATTKKLVENAATQLNIPIVDLNKGADAINNIEVARKNLDALQNLMNENGGLAASNRLTKIPNAVSNLFGKYTGSPQVSDFDAYKAAATQAMRAIINAKTVRLSPAMIQAAVDLLPDINDTKAQVDAKVSTLKNQLSAWEDIYIGSKDRNQQTQNTGTTSNGLSYTITY